MEIDLGSTAAAAADVPSSGSERLAAAGVSDRLTVPTQRCESAAGSVGGGGGGPSGRGYQRRRKLSTAGKVRNKPIL